MSTDLKKMMEQLIADQKEMKEQMVADQKERNVSIQKLENKLDNMEKSIEKLGSKVGNVFEISGRNELRRKFGDEFARNFVVSDLHGLVRLILPKNEQEGESTDGNTVLLQVERANSLAEYIAEKDEV